MTTVLGLRVGFVRRHRAVSLSITAGELATEQMSLNLLGGSFLMAQLP